MSVLWNIFGSGFKGGPDFNLNRTLRVTLNDIELELSIPDSNIAQGEDIHAPKILLEQEGWFEQHCSQLANHYFFPMAARRWVYIGPFRKVLREPFGSLLFNCWLKRENSEKSIPIVDLNTLQKSICWEYEKYFEVDEPGALLRGKNRKARQQADSIYGKSHWQNSVGEEQKKIFLEQETQELPSVFDEIKFGMQNWLCYSLKKEPNYPTRHYCQPLEKQFYIDIFFQHVIDQPKYYNVWRDHAEEAEQRIMQMIRLNFPNRLL